MSAPELKSSLIVHEDEHLLVVNKPPGLNTHSPSPYAGEGIYEWLRNREPRWTTLAIVHRLDKETSGLLVFGKTALANKSLTDQFARRQVTKKYLLVTDKPVRKSDFVIRSRIGRVGDKYTSHNGRDPQEAETRFHVLGSAPGLTTLEANPTTGRTHQIRVHASEGGLPIVGDKLYGGKPATRLHLHAAGLTFHHPATTESLSFEAPVQFDVGASAALRDAIIPVSDTNAYRIIHGGADGWPGWYVDRLGDFLLSQGGECLSAKQQELLEEASRGLRGVYHKVLARDPRRADTSELGPLHAIGDLALGPFTISENHLKFELSFEEGYSTGLFLDQRDNRRRFLMNHIAAGFPLFEEPGAAEVLNTFAYTCSFSVAAARAGARTTSVDLSRKYLEWGRRNFQINNVALGGHDFIYGDVFDWLRRFAKKNRAFDAVVLDPPTSSHSPEGFFTAERHYGKLVSAALAVLKPGGVLLASTNAARVEPEKFVSTVRSAVASGRRRITAEHYVPQPPDFPITRDEPGYLKTIWLRVV